MRNQSEFRVFKTQWTADKQSRLAPEQVSDTTWVFIILYKNIFKFEKHNGATVTETQTDSSHTWAAAQIDPD
jgi:hypothetical protein